jgi:hypothetical protein
MLCEFAKSNRGDPDRHLFFHHVAAYRPSEPLLPLFDYHDAFNGGQLVPSGCFRKR